jgi:hypothetical protein
MKALTLWPEWAWAVTHLGKTIENRPYPPPESLIGQRIAIHAGVMVGGRTERWGRPFLEAFGLVMDMAGDAGWGPIIIKNDQRIEFRKGSAAIDFDLQALHRGAVVATARVPGYYGYNVSRHWGAPGQYQWRIADVKVLAKPVPCRGYQRLWNLSSDVERRVLEQDAAGLGVEA